MKLQSKSSVSDLFETLIYFQIEPISESRFATTSNDNIVRMFELPEIYTIRQYGSKEYVYSLLYDEELGLLLVGNGAGDLEILDEDYKLKQKLKIHSDLITHIRKVPNMKELLATASTDSTIKITKIYTS